MLNPELYGVNVSNGKNVVSKDLEGVFVRDIPRVDLEPKRRGISENIPDRKTEAREQS